MDRCFTALSICTRYSGSRSSQALIMPKEGGNQVYTPRDVGSDSRRTTIRVPSAFRTCTSDCETWQKTRMIWMIFDFSAAEVSGSAAMMFMRADDSGFNSPSLMNIRQKSFFGVGLCSSNTLHIPSSACTTRSRCSTKSSSKRSTRTFKPRQLDNG